MDHGSSFSSQTVCKRFNPRLIEQQGISLWKSHFWVSALWATRWQSHLAKAGHEVTVYNRTTAKADQWAAEFGGHVATTPKDAQSGRKLFACVGDDDDLRSITLLSEQGAFAGMSEGALFVDHTTASAEVARELDTTAKSLHIGFMDAPVSGGQQGAENGALTVMVGGNQVHFDRCTSN